MKQTPNLSVPDSIVTKDGSQILRTTSVADFSALIAQPTPSLQDVTTVGATTTTTIQSIGFHAVPSSGFNGSFLLPENLRVFDNVNDFVDLSMVLTYPTAIFGKDGFESSLSTIDLTADRNINLPNNNGTLVLDSDLLNYVTIDTDQIITGAKTFSNLIEAENNIHFGNSSTAGLIQLFDFAGAPQTVLTANLIDGDIGIDSRRNLLMKQDSYFEKGINKQFEFINGTAGDIVGLPRLVYLESDGKYYYASATLENTISKDILIILETLLVDEVGEIATNGTIGGFSGLVVGDAYYISESLTGEVTNDRSTFSSGSFSKYVGTAKSATELYFNPSSTYIEIF